MQKVEIYSGGFVSTPIEIRCKSVNVSPTSILTRSPIESGVYINDCRVRQPITIKIKASLPVVEGWYNTIQALRYLHDTTQNWQVSTESLATVVTKEGFYDNLVLLNCPHTEGVDHFNTFEFDLTFQEIIISGNSKPSVRDAEDNDVKNIGQV